MLKTGLELVVEAEKIRSLSEQLSLTVRKQGKPQGSLQRQPGGLVWGLPRGPIPHAWPSASVPYDSAVEQARPSQVGWGEPVGLVEHGWAGL